MTTRTRTGSPAASRRRRALVPALAAVALAATTLGGGSAATAGHDFTGVDFDLAALPAPEADGAAIVDAVDAFSTAHPVRVTGSPTEVMAAQDIAGEFRALGYDTSTLDVAVVAGAPTPLKAVTATKRGTTRPDEWIMLIGHYDSVPQTVYGAYDNGSGTAMLRALARELADVPTHRSIVFALYNGEEEGVLASSRHAQALKAAGQSITAVLGFDMVGIAWPVVTEQASSCLCLFHGAADRERFQPLLRDVNFDFLQFPDHPRKVSVVGTNTRNSDERSFAQQGYPTLRWAGMRTASSYPAYHLPHDTLDTMVQVAGSRAALELGMANTLKSAYYTALALDNHAPVPAFTTSVDGARLVVDGTGTTDEDGGTPALSWDFGDGSTASGPVAQHTYAAPGTYTVTLTVADDLWPSVTRATTQSITVR
ncbi:MAG TPA: M28 family peptidase [Mycobacteriales bacterium]|nr:M28 family peptidase [Mycobacteriales bacterium]